MRSEIAYRNEFTKNKKTSFKNLTSPKPLAKKKEINSTSREDK